MTEPGPTREEARRAAARAGWRLGGGCLVLVLGAAAVVALLALGLELLQDVATDPAVVRARVPLLVGAGALGAAWFLALGGVRVARQPRTPPAAPASPDLPAEPPAVANMLVNDFEVDRQAIPATLLDLAARRLVEIEELARGDVRVRLRPRAEAGGLTAYEERVLSLLRGRAHEGVVPAGALTIGRKDLARSWWRGFRKEVREDAKARGLSRDLWAGLTWGFSLGAVLPAPLVFLGTGEPAPAIGVTVALLVILGALRESGRQRDTDAGLVAASRCIGVRRYLRDGAFDDLPPTAVAIWERYLAYAVAFGIAHRSLATFPMGADEDRRAWSSYGGDWRVVGIRYPRLLPPGWGWRPWAAALAGAAGMALAALVLRGAFAILGPEDPGGLPQEAAGAIRIGALGALAAGGLLALWSIALFVRGVGDLGSRREVRGLVLRLRAFGGSDESEPRYYAALDDGRSPRIRAFRLRPEVPGRGSLAEYREATAVVTRGLRYVREIHGA